MNQIIPKSIYQDKNYILIVNAKPNSKQSLITNIDDDGVDINIAAPPRDGEANKELIEYLSDQLEIKKTDIQIRTGTKGRDKVVVIDSKAFKSIEDLYNKLKS
ncbi:hypothetical protein pb186bvf_015167 [Paramecium bursaria]